MPMVGRERSNRSVLSVLSVLRTTEHYGAAWDTYVPGRFTAGETPASPVDA